MYYLGIGFVLTGLMLALSVGIAMMKYSNQYTLMHASGVTDAIGSVITMVGLAFLLFGEAEIGAGLKLMVLAALVYIANPMSAYSFAKVLYFYEDEDLDKK